MTTFQSVVCVATFVVTIAAAGCCQQRASNMATTFTFTDKSRPLVVSMQIPNDPHDQRSTISVSFRGSLDHYGDVLVRVGDGLTPLSSYVDEISQLRAADFHNMGGDSWVLRYGDLAVERKGKALSLVQFWYTQSSRDSVAVLVDNIEFSAAKRGDLNSVVAGMRGQIGKYEEVVTHIGLK